MSATFDPPGMAPEDRRLGRPGLGWWIMTVLAFGVAGYTLLFLFGTPPSDPAIKAMMLDTPAGAIHVLGGAVAIMLGPYQLLPGLRERRPRAHRWIGRTYLLGILGSGAASLFVSAHSTTYVAGDIGFGALGTLWLVTAALGYVAIRRGRTDAHRRWMTRNYALTYAAVMLRWQVGVLISFGLTSAMALTVTAYLCWIPNVVFVELRLMGSRVRSMC